MHLMTLKKTCVEIATSQNQRWSLMLQIRGYLSPRVSHSSLYQSTLPQCRFPVAYFGTTLTVPDSLVKVALQRYKELYLNMVVPSKFIIPKDSEEWPEAVRGVKLGNLVMDIRGGARKNMHEELLRMGFNFKPQSTGKWSNENLKRALLLYKDLHGTMLVPKAFVVPRGGDIWPETCWGMKLGGIVAEIREGVNRVAMRAELESIGFDYTTVRQLRVLPFEEFKLALLTYKRLHGDTLVAFKFSVPENNDDWPAELWKMRLGEYVSRVRHGRRYSENREELESIGFDYDANKTRVYSDEEVTVALVRYKELYGINPITTDFQIPENCDKWPEITRGMRLAFIVSEIRYGNRTELRGIIENLGFRYHPMYFDRRYAFSVVKYALLRYKDRYGDLLVPRDYIVPTPTDAFGSSVWGMGLGKIVSDIRGGRVLKTKKDQLIRMSFDFRSQWVGQFNGFEKIKAALIQYRELYGDMSVPPDYIVPQSEDWEEDQWGMVLGHITQKIRDDNRYLSKHDELESIGFKFSSHRLTERSNLVKIALERYNELYGDMLVPIKFIIPDECDEWSEEMWGMLLGKIVNATRAGNSHVRMRDDLSEMGFDFYKQKELKNASHHLIVNLALQSYKEKHGNVFVPKDFIIPSDNIEWPRQTWGLKLGKLNRKILFGTKYLTEKKELRYLGYDYSSQRLVRSNGVKFVKVAIERYFQLFGDVHVPTLFKVPDENPEWPESVWGMKLGLIVEAMSLDKTTKGVLKGLLKELQSMGYNFSKVANYSKPRLYSEELVKAAILRYHEINGNLTMTKHYCIEDESIEYPKEMWKMPLGHIVHRMRIKGDREKLKEELENMGIMLTRAEIGVYGYSTVLLALQTYKSIYGHISIKNSFVIPKNDQKWPEKLWGIKLGFWMTEMKCGGMYTVHRENFIKMGVDYQDGIDSNIYHMTVMKALKRFKQLKGHIRIAATYKVPFDSKAWDSSLWGFKLGCASRRIRGGKILTQRRKEYEALGIVYYDGDTIESLERRIKISMSKYKGVEDEEDVTGEYLESV